MRLQNDSMTTSSQSPMELIDGSSPESTARRVNAQVQAIELVRDSPASSPRDDYWAHATEG
jgi:hypothetical protein